MARASAVFPAVGEKGNQRAAIANVFLRAVPDERFVRTKSTFPDTCSMVRFAGSIRDLTPPTDGRLTTQNGHR
jgi:hypothetical protein